MRRSAPRHPGPGVLRPTENITARPQWWSRLLDGAHQWGSFDATVGRYGIQRYRLTIYPPGGTTADRRLARLWRGWPITGAVLGLLAIMVLGNAAASPDTMLEIFVDSYVGVGVLLFLRAGPLRVRVRSMSIVLLPNSDDAHERHKYAEWRTLAGGMTCADRMLASGAISVVEHEAIWWEAYDRVEAIAHV